MPTEQQRNLTPQRSVCTQWQIRYTCGHTLNMEFVKCPTHEKKEEERCRYGVWEYMDAKYSTHKCRECLKSA
jgi:hypothetical protein